MGDLPFPRSPLLIVTVVRLEGTVKRHIVHWMKKTSSCSHDKDQQLTCPKTINYRTIFHTTLLPDYHLRHPIFIEENQFISDKCRFCGTFSEHKRMTLLPGRVVAVVT